MTILSVLGERMKARDPRRSPYKKDIDSSVLRDDPWTAPATEKSKDLVTKLRGLLALGGRDGAPRWTLSKTKGHLTAQPEPRYKVGAGIRSK